MMSVRNVFSKMASRVVRVLLIDPEREWSILGLSREAKTGYGHAYRVVETLLKVGVCRKTESNRVAVSNAGELLARWASFFDFALLNKANAYYSLIGGFDEFINKLVVVGKRGFEYALTLHAGAALIAPYVRPTNVHLYIDSKFLRDWQDLLDLQLTELGGNVFLVEPYDEGVFYKVQRPKGVSVVSNVQLYVDLYNYPARGREAAEHLRKEFIGF